MFFTQFNEIIDILLGINWMLLIKGSQLCPFTIEL